MERSRSAETALSAPLCNLYVRARTLEDIRGQYRRAENYVCLHPVSVVSHDDVRAEVLKVLLGNIDSEAVEKVSESLGVARAHGRLIDR